MFWSGLASAHLGDAELYHSRNSRPIGAAGQFPGRQSARWFLTPDRLNFHSEAKSMPVQGKEEYDEFSRRRAPMSDRKYRQRGYQDSGKPEKKDRPRAPQPGPPRHLNQLGPRTPRMVGTVVRARCATCGTVLPAEFDVNGKCPKCKADLHSCKQCVHFDTSAQFECTQPISERIARKDAKNECTFFAFRTTIEKDTSPVSASPQAAPTATPSSARQAFDDLFKK